MFHCLSLVLRLRALARRADLDDRATVLALVARFVDELGSGLLVVLMPSLLSRLGLSVGQVGWCLQALFTAGALVEPASGAAIDVVSRRPLLVCGAAGWAGALLLAAGAPGFGWLLVAFALAGGAYGPLANTADVVLVEGHPAAVERIASRSTALDTVGALLAPVAVAAASWGGIDERALLAAAGLGTLGYAWLLAGSTLPEPAGHASGATVRRQVARNVASVVGDRRARLAIGTLVVLEVLEGPAGFEPVWLGQVVGLPQSLVAVHSAIGLASGLVAIVAVDRWLASHDARPLLVASVAATFLVYPVWLLVGGVTSKLAFVAVREAVAAPLWPILHARALASTPGRAGAVSTPAPWRRHPGGPARSARSARWPGCCPCTR